MNLNAFNPSFEQLMNGSRILWGAGDIWKTDNNGVPHRHIDKYGNKLSVFIPECIPFTYKRRKATSAIIWCNSCDMVTVVEIHYGRPGCGGYAVTYSENMEPKDVTDFYKGGRK